MCDTNLFPALWRFAGRTARVWLQVIALFWLAGAGALNAADEASAKEYAVFYQKVAGTNFEFRVPNFAPGTYTAVFGFMETEYSRPGERVFDIYNGSQLLASNLDVLVAAGGLNKPYILRLKVEHYGDVVSGPLDFRFVAQKGQAMVSAMEIHNAEDKILFAARASDLAGEDPVAAREPEVPGPVLWKDPAQPVAVRIKDLVSRMSLNEKVAQLRNGTPSIWRLGVPAYDYWSECLHGVARAGVATVFPQAIGLAATWNTPLIHQMADVIATEARAKHNAYASLHEGDSAKYIGLSFWTPNINLFRDPRWGRGQETYGEDPFLTGRMAVAFIRGLQGDDATYVKALACAKHFAVHSGPEWDRHRFDAAPSARDLYECYLPQFEAAVREGHVGAVMGAYNRLYGEPACSSGFLLTDLLRRQWGFTGHVVSDCGAIFDIYAYHQVVNTPEEAAARALRAGCDLCCGTNYDGLTRAVRVGLIREKEIDQALSRVLEARFRLGVFDPTDAVAYARIPLTQNDTQEHEALALSIARESMVLLKNDGLLPLDRSKIKRIAVIGMNAQSVIMLVGNYNGVPARPVTILDGIKAVAGPKIEVAFDPGCPLTLHRDETNQSNAGVFSDAIGLAKQADVVIYAGGLSPELEGEQMDVELDGFIGGDRTRIELPLIQTELLKALQATGKPVVFVHCSGSAVAMPWAAKNLPAILQAWYPGEQGGRAVAEVLFGDYSPAGRLPITFYQATADLPEFTDYSMTNRTYRFFNGTPLFAFGHGLSYTRFDYLNARINATNAQASETLRLSFDLKNAGSVDGDEVAQVYFHTLKPGLFRGKEALCGFARVHVARGASASASIEIPLERLRSWSSAAKRYVVEPGDYELLLGAASDDIRASVPFKVAEAAPPADSSSHP